MITHSIDSACSLGFSCHSSQILKRNKYKRCSYPFDWIFSNCDNIIHCIQSNFNIFLDKSYYIDISPSQCGHSKYHERMFNHHNPLANVDHYNYYVRCVDRFRNLLQNQENKLFITTLLNMNSVDDDVKNEMIKLNTELSKYTSNYRLLVIIHIPNKEQNHSIFTCNDNIDFLELHTLSTSCGVQFYNNDDNTYLDNIIKSKYDFTIDNIDK